jgi:hypothetical protein
MFGPKLLRKPAAPNSLELAYGSDGLSVMRIGTRMKHES